MPFGKLKNWEIHKMPRGYLRWLLESCKLDEPLRTAVMLGLDRIEYDPKPVDIDEMVHKICEPWPEQQSR